MSMLSKSGPASKVHPSHSLRVYYLYRHADLRLGMLIAEWLTFLSPTSRPEPLLPPQPPHQMDPPRRRHRRCRYLSYALERAAR